MFGISFLSLWFRDRSAACFLVITSDLGTFVIITINPNQYEAGYIPAEDKHTCDIKTREALCFICWPMSVLNQCSPGIRQSHDPPPSDKTTGFQGRLKKRRSFVQYRHNTRTHSILTISYQIHLINVHLSIFVQGKWMIGACSWIRILAVLIGAHFLSIDMKARIVEVG